MYVWYSLEELFVLLLFEGVVVDNKEQFSSTLATVSQEDEALVDDMMQGEPLQTVEPGTDLLLKICVCVYIYVLVWYIFFINIEKIREIRV